MKFTTILRNTRDVSIYGLPENAEVESVDFVIEWEMQIETREYGIKEISFVVTNVAGEYEIETFDDNSDTRSLEQVEFDFEPYRENCTFTAEITEWRQLFISLLEIDLDEKSLEVL